LSYGGPLRW